MPACLYVSVRLCVRAQAVRGCHRCGFLSPPCLRQVLWYLFAVCTRLVGKNPRSLPSLPLPSRPECTVTSGFICVLGIQTLPQQAAYLRNACFVSDLECFPGSNLGQWSTEAVKCRLTWTEKLDLIVEQKTDGALVFRKDWELLVFSFWWVC